MQERKISQARVSVNLAYPELANKNPGIQEYNLDVIDELKNNLCSHMIFKEQVLKLIHKLEILPVQKSSRYIIFF